MELSEVSRLWLSAAGSESLKQLDSEQSYRPEWKDEETFFQAQPEVSVPRLDGSEEATLSHAHVGADSGASHEAGTRYQVCEPLGRGGQGVVYRAHQACLRREVAVKQVLPEHLRSSERARSHNRAFLSEALVTGRLEHPNIVPVYELGESEAGQPFLAMKLVDGKPWKELLHGDSDVHRHLEILLQVCNAVAFAHNQGIVHSDLKPSNVMVGDFGEVLLMDWGLAVGFDAQRSNEYLRMNTRIFRPFGTPAYSPPELALGLGQLIGPATDVYLLGAILYEILTGQPPHKKSGFLESVLCASEGKCVELPEQVPEELAGICKQAMAGKTAERFSSVRDFQQALRAYLQHRESQKVALRAQELLHSCTQRKPDRLPEEARNHLYEDYAAAIAGFDQAQHLWSENGEARHNQLEARFAYAEAALEHGDLGLAQSQLARLQSSVPHKSPLLQRLQEVGDALQGARLKRQRQRRQTKILAISLLACLLLLVTGLFVSRAFILEEKRQAEFERGQARAAERRADGARQTAEEERDRAAAMRDVVTQALREVTRVASEDLLQSVRTEEASHAAKNLLGVAQLGWEQVGALAQGVEELPSAMAHVSLGQLHENVFGDLEAAEREYRAAQGLLARYSTPESARQRVDALRIYGEFERRRGGLTRARELLKEAVVTARSHALVGKELVGCLRSFAELLRELGDLQAALPLLEEACGAARAIAETDPGAVRELYTLLFELSLTYEQGGALDAAVQTQSEALELCRDHHAERAGSALRVRELMGGLHQGARLLERQGRLPEALEQQEAALQHARELMGRNSEDVQALEALVDNLLQYGQLYLTKGELQAFDRYCQDALQVAQAFHQKHATLLPAQEVYAATLGSLADLASQRRRLAEAEELAQRCLVLRRSLHAAAPASETHRFALAEALVRLAEIQFQRTAVRHARTAAEEALELLQGGADARGRLRALLVLVEALVQDREHERAAVLCAQALEIARNAAAGSALDAEARADLRRALGSAARVAEGNREFQQAVDCYEEIVENGRRGLSGEPENPELRFLLCLSLRDYARLLVMADFAEAALAEIDAGIALGKDLLALYPENFSFQRELLIQQTIKASVFLQTDRLPEARQLLESSFADWEELVARDGADMLSRRGLGLCHLQSGALLAAQAEYASALQALAPGLDLLEEILREQPGDLLFKRDCAMAHRHIFEAHQGLAQHAQAVSALEDFARFMEPLTPAQLDALAADYALLLIDLMESGTNKRHAGQLEEALEEFQAAVYLGRELQHLSREASAPSELSLSLAATAALYAELGRFEEALPLLEECLALEPGAEQLLTAGRVYQQAGRLEGARLLLEQAIGLAPEGYLSWKYLGEVLGALGRHGRAAEAFRQALSLENDEQYWLNVLLGNELRQNGNLQEAVDAYTDSLAHRRSGLSLLLRGLLHHLLGQPAACEEDLRQALEIWPDAHVALWLSAIVRDAAPLADFTEEEGVLGALVGLFCEEAEPDAAIQAAAGDARLLTKALGFVGLYFDARGDTTAARAYYERAVELGVSVSLQYQWAFMRLKVLNGAWE